MAQQGVRGWCGFLAGKAAHLLLALAILCWLLPPAIGIGQILLVYLLSQMLSSLLFVMLIIGTHWAKANFIRRRRRVRCRTAGITMCSPLPSTG